MPTEPAAGRGGDPSTGADRPVLAGGCLCGRVRFSYTGPLAGELGAATVCHCSQCRRAQGFAAAVAPILAAAYRIEQGREAVVEYKSSPGKLRAFCGGCGSPLYSRRPDAPDTLRLRLGALDDPPASLRIDAHIFTGAAPEWAWPSAAPAYDGMEPGRS